MFFLPLCALGHIIGCIFPFYLVIILFVIYYFIFNSLKFSLVIFAIIGSFQVYFYETNFSKYQHILSAYHQKSISLKGRFIKINNDSKISDFQLHDSNIFLRVSHKQNLTSLGNLVEIYGIFFFPDISRNPGGFNKQIFYRYKHIVGGFKLNHLIKIDDNFRQNYFKSFAYYIKNKVVHLHRSTLPYPYSDLFIGLIFGRDGTRLPLQLSHLYQKCGLIHLLVVSGAQTTLISQTLIYFFSLLKISKILQFLLITLVQIVFYFLTGGGETIFRAILMNEIVLGLSVFKRKTSPLHTLSATGLCLGIINPFSYKNIGVQLSFLATASLIYATPICEHLLPNKLSLKIKKWISVSITPSIITMPIISYYFHIINPLSLLSNLLIVFWIEILVIYGFFTTLLSFILPSLLIVTNKFSLLLMIYLNKLVKLLNHIPYSNISIGKIPLFFVFLIYLSLFLYIFAFYDFKFKKKIIVFFRFCKNYLIIFFVFIFASSVYLFLNSNDHLKIIFIDIDQGDSTLIITENNKTILIDGGNATQFKDYGYSTILPLLRYLKINCLDYVMLTHADSDHYKGLISVINEIKTDVFIYNGNFVPHDLQQVLNKKKVKISVFPDSNFIRIDSIKIQNINIHPYLYKEKNNKSLVLKISHFENHILLTGDIEKEVESVLLNSPYLHDIDILKIPHHGSNTSTTFDFLNKIKPEIAVISAGRNNNFNHPHPDVINRLNLFNVRVFRTDLNGAIKIESNENYLTVKSML